jgi:prepilin-type processing-associated H-X9-DG protein
VVGFVQWRQRAFIGFHYATPAGVGQSGSDRRPAVAPRHPCDTPATVCQPCGLCPSAAGTAVQHSLPNHSLSKGVNVRVCHLMKQSKRQSQRGFTRTDLCALLVAVSLLAVLCLPALAKMKPHSDRATCVNNLRQLGVGWQCWAKDNGNLPPWYVVPANGGTKTIGIPYVHFAIISNYLASPMVMVCPSDSAKIPALDFSSNPSRGLLSTNFQNNAIGYFIGTEVTVDEPRAMLAGDRDVQSSLLIALGNCGSVSFNTAKIRSGGFWPKNSFHAGAGNVLFCDGSARVVNATGLVRAVLDNPVDGNKSGCILIP